MSQISQELSADKLKSRGSKRVFFLDNLKIALTILVLANHASQAYTSINTGWPIQQGNIPELTNYLIVLFLSVNSTFFMALFFLISAFFIPISLERKQTKQFLKDRFVRLGIPVIIIPFIILPILLIPLYAGNKSPVDFIFKEYFNPSKGLFQLAHTWFLVDLLIFTCFYALYKGIKKCRKDNKPELLKVPGNLKIGLFALGLSFILFAVRIFIPTGWWAPLHLFEPGRFPAYIAMFIVGLVAYKHKWIEKIPTSTGVLWGIVSVAAILAAPAIDVFILGGTYMWAKGFTLNSLVVSAWDAILCVGLCTSMIVLFRQKFNFQNKVLKTMANDSFAVYLIHPFLLVWLHVLILNVPMHPFVKFIAVTIAGTIICYALSHLIKKIPGVSKVL